jgi:hypothetical protein
MKIAWQIAALSVMLSLGCKELGDARFIRQQIPIEIQSGKPVTIEIRSLSGNGWNEVGIRCTPDVWQKLDAKNNFAVRLISSDEKGTEVSYVSPSDDYKLWPVESFYYLFSIDGKYRADASVEITFKSAPEGVTHAEILVLKTPSDTGL